MSRLKFQKYWINQHANLVQAKLATYQYVKRYVHRSNI
ncbi:EthD domain-containing protein [uncultured Brevibacillus sp.]|nr:EthD domain-containing protein [uncultured Brevibacillus sp.]